MIVGKTDKDLQCDGKWWNLESMRANRYQNTYVEGDSEPEDGEGQWQSKNVACKLNSY